MVSVGGGERLSWSSEQVYPFAGVTLRYRRGGEAPGSTVHLELRVRTPAGEERVVQAASVAAPISELSWSVRLAFDHAELTPGEYTWAVVASVGGEQVWSRPVSYRVRQFTFGV